MKRNISKLLAGYVGLTLVICLLVIGFSAKAGADAVRYTGNIVINNSNVSIDNQGNSPDSSIGAYVDSGQVTTFTDVNITNDLVVDGYSNFKRIFPGGLAYASNTTKAFTLTATNICDYAKVTITASTTQGAGTADSYAVTLPATSTVSSRCLITEGQYLSFLYINGSAFASSTVITANTDYNLYYTSTSTTVGGGKLAQIMCRRGATAYDCTIDQKHK